MMAVAVAVSGSNFGPYHPMEGVPQLVDVAETIGFVKHDHPKED
ncbi:hypothetical protein [Paenibacillus anseongense]|nr:hypothetical protein [Paenibacillus anseongense]MEC0271310.1 hypothetical protein [Paenibacillus anseongense]